MQVLYASDCVVMIRGRTLVMTPKALGLLQEAQGDDSKGPICMQRKEEEKHFLQRNFFLLFGFLLEERSNSAHNCFLQKSKRKVHFKGVVKTPIYVAKLIFLIKSDIYTFNHSFVQIKVLKMVFNYMLYRLSPQGDSSHLNSPHFSTYQLCYGLLSSVIIISSHISPPPSLSCCPKLLMTRIPNPRTIYKHLDTNLKQF